MNLGKKRYAKFLEVDVQQEKKHLVLLKFVEVKAKEYHV